MDHLNTQHNNNDRPYSEERKKLYIKRGKKRFFVILGTLFLLIFIGFLYRVSNVLTIAGRGEVGTYKNFKVEKDPNRLNILLLGIRGVGDPNGGLLADTIIILSFDKKQEKAALISIPRDFYVEMPQHTRPERINFAYALGEQRKPNGGGLALSREVAQYVTGLYIDNAIVINLHGFKKVVDTLGGVEIYRTTDFYEAQQWQGEGNPLSPFWYKAKAQDIPDLESEELREEQIKEINEADLSEYWVFHVPKGRSVLNGEDALYYIRSRYSTSDFDRIKRQQEVIESLKDKALSLGVLTNPVKIYQIIDTLGNNVKTDMGLGDVREVVALMEKYAKVPIEGTLLDTSEKGLLKSDNVNGAFVLLPKDNNLETIRQFFENIFE